MLWMLGKVSFNELRVMLVYLAYLRRIVLGLQGLKQRVGQSRNPFSMAREVWAKF